MTRTAAALGRVPVLVGGDFNQDPLPPAAEFALRDWVDLLPDCGPTTDPGGGGWGAASTGSSPTRQRSPWA